MGSEFVNFGGDDEPVPIVAADAITICRASDDKHYTKIWDGGAEEPRKCPRPMYNDFSSEPVKSIYDVHRVLESIRQDHRSCIVRGKLINPGDNRHVRRAHKSKATLESQPRHWMMLDVDNVDFAIDPLDPAAAVRHIQTLCPALRDVTVHYHCSGSWGIKPGPRIHLVYWLTEQAAEDACKAFAGSQPIKFDLSIYTPSQPHYTADPLFFNGAHDPCGDVPRAGLIHGALDELYIGDGNVQNELAYYCDVIRNISDDQPRHPIVNKAAYTLAGWCGPGYLTAEELHTQLITACADNDVFSAARLGEMDDEIRRAIEDGKERPRTIEQWRSLYIRNSEGLPRPLISNYIVALTHHPELRGKLAYDSRFQKTMALSALPWDAPGGVYPREVDDFDVTAVTNWISTIPNGAIPTNGIRDLNRAFDFVGHANKFDEVKRWLETLPPWDGVPRLSSIFTHACHAENNDYHRAVARVFVLSMIARGLRPGCKVDTMVVLCGRQGTYKSTFLKLMGSGPGEQYFSADLGDIRDVFSYLPTVKGKWLIEVGELAQFGGRHVEAIKTFVAKEVHVGREPYQARATSYPIGYVLTGSTNNHTFLTDTTGNRRFLPVRIHGHIDLEWVMRNRDMIFAEAKAAYLKGEKWYLDGSMVAVAERVQELYTANDPWIAKIAAYLDAPPSAPPGDVDQFDYDAVAAPAHKTAVTIEDVLIEALDMHPGRVDTKSSVRCGECLTVLGWSKTRKRIDGKRRYVYERPKGE